MAKNSNNSDDEQGYINGKKEGVGGTCTYYPPNSTVLSMRDRHKRQSLLFSEYYIVCLFLLTTRGYFHYKELKEYGNVNWQHYIKHLKRLSIIRSTKLSKELKLKYHDIMGYGTSHINSMKFYCFTSLGFEFFSKIEHKEFINESFDKVNHEIYTQYEQKFIDARNRNEKEFITKLTIARMKIKNNVPLDPSDVLTLEEEKNKGGYIQCTHVSKSFEVKR